MHGVNAYFVAVVASRILHILRKYEYITLMAAMESGGLLSERPNFLPSLKCSTLVCYIKNGND